MKIGIITFHRAINYGAALQTYALQKHLRDNNYDAEVIDYRCDHTEQFYKVLSIKNKTRNMIIRGLLNFGFTYKKKKSFHNFLNKNVNISGKIYDKTNINTANDVYDKFITGSDQVFNYACSNFDKNYFLEFVKDENKMYSYAASFGMKSLPNEYNDDYKCLLNRFNKLSIREVDGQKIVKNLIDKDTELTLDPVFLLEQDDWSKIAIKPKLNHYILVYKLNTSNLIFDFARKLAEKTGCKIVALNYDVVDQLKTPDIKGLLCASVEEFLGYFKYADYVVTNSFHGTAFSVIFHKNLYVEALQKDFKPNDRVESLLSLTNLNNCKISTLEDCTLNVDRDFEFSDSQIKKERIKAKKYLEGILNE